MRMVLLCSGALGLETALDAIERLAESGLAVDELHVVATTKARQRLEGELAGLRGAVPGSSFVHAPEPVADDVPHDVLLRALADLAFARVSEAVTRSARVVVALPRGRHDMVGFMLMSALQALGRVGDRVIATPDGTELPLLQLLPPVAPAAVVDVARATDGVQARTGRPPTIWLHDHSRTVEVDGILVTLRPAQYFWYSALVTYSGPAPTLNDLRAAGCAGRSKDLACPARHLRAHLEARYARLFPDADRDVTDFILRAVGDPANLLPIVSHLNARLRRALGPAATRYLLRSPRWAPGYRVDIDQTSIRTL